MRPSLLARAQMWQLGCGALHPTKQWTKARDHILFQWLKSVAWHLKGPGPCTLSQDLPVWWHGRPRYKKGESPELQKSVSKSCEENSLGLERGSASIRRVAYFSPHGCQRASPDLASFLKTQSNRQADKGRPTPGAPGMRGEEGPSSASPVTTFT